MLSYTLLASGNFEVVNRTEAIETFILDAYNRPEIDYAESCTANLLRDQTWEFQSEMLAALTDFGIVPTTSELKSVIEDLLLSENALVFVSAAQWLIRSKIPINHLKAGISEKRLAALAKLEIQFQ